MLKTAYAIGQLEALEAFGLEKTAVNARLLGTLAGSALGSMAAPEGEGLQGAILGGAGGYLGGAGLSRLGQAGGKALEGAKGLYNKATGISDFQTSMDKIHDTARHMIPTRWGSEHLTRSNAARRAARARAGNVTPPAAPPGILGRAENWLGEKVIDPMMHFIDPGTAHASQVAASPVAPPTGPAKKKPSNAAPPAKKKPSNAAPQSQRATGTNP